MRLTSCGAFILNRKATRIYLRRDNVRVSESEWQSRRGCLPCTILGQRASRRRLSEVKLTNGPPKNTIPGCHFELHCLRVSVWRSWDRLYIRDGWVPLDTHPRHNTNASTESHLVRNFLPYPQRLWAYAPETGVVFFFARRPFLSSYLPWIRRVRVG